MPFITQGKTNIKYLLIIVILAIIVGGGVLWSSREQRVSLTPLSAVVEKINQEKVESIIVQGTDIEVVLKNGTRLYSKREVEEGALSENLLEYGVTTEKLKKVMIETKAVEQSLTNWLGPILFFLPIIYFAFIIIAPYYIILWGFKIFKISGISNSKIIGYVIIYVALVFLVEKLFNPLVGLGVESNRLIYYFTNNFIYLAVNFLLLKYYLKLSGKKLWHFFLYLIVTGLIFSVLISLLAKISF